ncbi:MAG: quinolinate synthase NadA [Kiritimatiellia bacterium]
MTTLLARIAELRLRKQAIILAHNYQLPEVQDLADFTGDSLELSRKAAATDAEVVVFCGVWFMAETAAILCPGKTVLIPDRHAGCPMVDMAPVDEVKAFKALHPGAVVVTYVNSSAEVKAESDICCTSANAVAVVRGIPRDRDILFVPDRNLGAFVAAQTGRDLILYPGYCPTHAKLRAEDVLLARESHPEAAVMIHPECRPEVTALGDAVLSTSGMCRFARESPAKSFIVGTETGLLHRLRQENPGKTFYPLFESAVCPNMKRITPEKVLFTLEDDQVHVTVPEPIRLRALEAVNRMIAIS